MRYLFEKLTSYQTDDEIYKLLPNKIDPDVISSSEVGLIRQILYSLSNNNYF